MTDQAKDYYWSKRQGGSYLQQHETRCLTAITERKVLLVTVLCDWHAVAGPPNQ